MAKANDPRQIRIPSQRDYLKEEILDMYLLADGRISREPKGPSWRILFQKYGKANRMPELDAKLKEMYLAGELRQVRGNEPHLTDIGKDVYFPGKEWRQ